MAASGQSRSQDSSPTPSPTTYYHHENQLLFEYIAIGALGLMVFILFVAFFGDWCFNRVRQQKDMSPLESRHFGRESSREEAVKHALELTSGTLKDTPMTLLNKIKKALDIRNREMGDVELPEYWRVPAKAPWPQDLWGFELGKAVNGMCGTSNVHPQTSIHTGGTLKKRAIGASDRSMHSSSSPSSSQHSSSSTGGMSYRADDHDDEEHRHETWYELFYDLVFVAAALQLGMVIKYDHRVLGMLKAAVLFLMLRSTWDHLTMYQNRFHVNDSTHMAYYLMQSMGAFVIALHLQVEDDVHHENQHSWDREKHQHPISLMATLCRILTVVMYIRSAYTHQEHRAYLKRIIMHTTASAVIFAISMLTPTDDDNRIYLIVWFIGILVERPLMHVIACAAPTSSPPLVLKKHIGHLVSRQGTFFMLILGEAVIQLVQAHGGYDFPSYVRAVLGFAVVFNVGNVYYEQQQREPTRHVLVRSATLGYVWVELQSLLSMFVLFFAVGVKVVFHSFDEYQELRDEFLMCGFASLSLLLMYSMSLMHRGFEFNFHGTPRRLFYHTFFYSVAVACGMVPLFATSTTICIAILHILTSSIVIQDIASRTLRIRELSAIVNLSERDASKAWASAMDTSINSDIYNYGRDGMDSSTSSRIGLTVGA